MVVYVELVYREGEGEGEGSLCPQRGRDRNIITYFSPQELVQQEVGRRFGSFAQSV